jgi:hypothetical protein
VTGFRREGTSYSVEVVDTVTGYPVVVRSAEAWRDRIGEKP